LNPDDLLVTGNGYNFNKSAEEITILFKENLMPIVTQVNVQKESNVDSYIVMMMTTENVLIKFMNPSDVVYNKEKIKQIEILFVNTTDNLPIRNVKIELKGCHRESTDVKSATTEALSMSTTTYLVNTTCEEAAVYTDILLDRNAVEEINDEADRTIDLNTINTAEENSLGWSQDLASDFLDIKLDYAIDVRLIEVVNGSNVRKYSLEMIDEDDDRIKVEV